MNDHFKRSVWLSSGIIGGSLIVTAIGLYFLHNTLSSQAQKIIADQLLVAQQTSALGSFATLKRDAPQAEKYTAAIKKLLPDQYQLIGYNEWFSGRAKLHNVMAHFSFNGSPIPSTDATAGTAAFGADAEGAPDNLLAFMKDIEVQAPGFLISISSFDLTDAGANSRVTMQGTLYFK